MPARTTKPKRVKMKDLATATQASVRAAIGKEPAGVIPKDILAGVILKRAQLANVAQPEELARTIAKQVRAESGITVTPQVAELGDGILVGYRMPRVLIK